MNRKKVILFFTVCLSFALLLSGCKHSETDSDTSGSSSTASSVSSGTTSSTDSSEPESPSEPSTSAPTVSRPNPKPNDTTSTESGRHLHTYRRETVAATCTADGYTVYKCVECGAEKERTVLPKKGHTFGEWTVLTAPTATAEGVQQRTCTVCGATEQQTLAKLIDFEALKNQVLELVNAERAKEGAEALVFDENLQKCADRRAEELVKEFGHLSREEFEKMFEEYGVLWTAYAENIASGQRTAEEVVNTWMHSDGHRGNILNPIYTATGIGVVRVNGTCYWVQLFTHPA